MCNVRDQKKKGENVPIEKGGNIGGANQEATKKFLLLLSFSNPLFWYR